MTTLSLTLIKRDGGLQPRAQLNEEVVAEYREIIKHQQATLPPVAIIYDGANHWLTDGYHRAEAYSQEGIDCIPVSITPGSYRDAVLASCKANATHGLRRTNEDKHRQVLRLLRDSEWSEWSDRKIAEHCQVGHPLVASLRKSLSGISSRCDENPQQNQPARKAERGGRTYTVNTATISHANKARAKPTLTLGKQVYQFIANNHPVTVDQVYEGLTRQGLLAKNEENLLAVKEMIGGFINNGDLESDWIVETEEDEPPTIYTLDTPATNGKSEPPTQEKPSSFKDELERIIPDANLPLFHLFAPKVKKIRQLLIQAREEWNTLAETLPMELKGFKGYHSVKGVLEKDIPYLIGLFQIALPYTFCVYCKGKEKECRACGDSHVITKEAFDRAPAKIRPAQSLTVKELNIKEGIAAL